MVGFETQQLAGLSDESFIHDYACFKPFHTYLNPALIAVCRQSIVEQRVAMLSDCEIKLHDVGLAGASLTSAFLDCNKGRATSTQELELLLDVGAESTTFVLMMADQILTMGNISAAGDAFTESIAQDRGISEQEAERLKCSGEQLPLPAPASALRDAFEVFVTDLEASLDNWRYQGEQNDLPVSRVFITGGGARLGSLAVFLERHLKCSVQNFTPFTESDNDGLTMSVAYGLALQGFTDTDAAVPISLAPNRIAWMTKRRQRFGYLQTSVAMLALTVIVAIAATAFGMRAKMDKLRKERAKLEQCEAMIPEMVAARNEIEHVQQMLIPFAAHGSRNEEFVRGLSVLGKYQHPDNDWLVYVADELSYMGGPIEYGGKLKDAPSSSSNPRAMFGTQQTNIATDPVTVVTTVPTWNYLIAAGFTPRREVNPLQNVRDTINAMNTEEDSSFASVDVHPDPQGKVYRVMQPWLTEFAQKPFFVQLPLKDVHYRPKPKPAKP
jgi:hypothetical protein